MSPSEYPDLMIDFGDDRSMTTAGKNRALQ